MLIPHDTRNAGRHTEHCPITNAIQTHTIAARLLLLSIIMTLIGVSDASAQEFPPNGPGSWGILIYSDFPQTSTVTVGDVTDDLSIITDELIIGETISRADTYTIWQVEPADAARILTPMPSYPSMAPVEIEFLRATTVTVRARAYHNGNFQPVLFESTGDIEQEFTFNVQASANASPEGTTDTDNEDTFSELSTNERQAKVATDLLCEAVNENTGAPLSEQDRLLATCDSIALLDDTAPAFDRISAEELFAIGDALTITADSQISNIQSRINKLRAQTSEQLDVTSLNIKLWDQNLPGSVLSTSARGGGASQDVMNDSALGLFASGNLAIGKIDGQGIQQDADISSNALTLGTDYRLDEHKVIGAAIGIVNDNTDFNADNGEMEMQGISLSAFGSWYEEDKGYADIIIDIARHSFDLSRRMNLPGQASEFAHGAASANRMALSVNAGRTFQRGATEFGPVVRIAMTRASIDGFVETSSLTDAGNGMELDVQSHNMTSLRFSLGADLRHVINTSKAVLVPAARVDLEVENDTDKGVISATFVNDPAGNTMNFIGTERDSTAVLLSVGTTATFKYGQSAFVFFETRIRDDHVSQNRLRVGYRMHF